MKIYNAIGVSTVLFHVGMAALLAPAGWGPLLGGLGGLAYLVTVWFGGGLYLSDVIHMDLAHRALDYRPWFTKTVSFLFNTFGIYINPQSWTNRHRLHHMNADQPGDPNKLAQDGFWKTLFLCVFPYRCERNLARDPIFSTWAFRLICNPIYAVIAQFTSFGLLFLLTRDWRYSASLWLGMRVFALWINMIQNYWAHDRRWGTRRYADEHDNAMNLGDWLPVTVSFSASLQNNHHHASGAARLSHVAGEYDFGFLTVRALNSLGLVEPTAAGLQMPDDAELHELGL